MKDFRIIAGVGAIGGLAALLLAAPSVLPTIAAQEQPVRNIVSVAEDLLVPPPVDTEGLLKWGMVVEPGISTTPLRETVVRKIGYGRTEFVRVVETASGVYSSDALDSAHIRYPGLHRDRAAQADGLAFWSGSGWQKIAAFSAKSFVTITPFEGGQLIVTDDRICVVLADSVDC